MNSGQITEERTVRVKNVPDFGARVPGNCAFLSEIPPGHHSEGT